MRFTDRPADPADYLPPHPSQKVTEVVTLISGVDGDCWERYLTEEDDA